LKIHLCSKFNYEFPLKFNFTGFVTITIDIVTFVVMAQAIVVGSSSSNAKNNNI